MQRQAGFILVFLMLALTMLLGMLGMAVDLGVTYHQKRIIQAGADAASWAAVLSLPAANLSTIQTIARSMGNSNGLTNAEMTTIECGTWDNSTFTLSSPSNSCNGSGINAVRVLAQRIIPTRFAWAVGQNDFRPLVESIALLPINTVCIQPFGVDKAIIDPVSINGQFSIDAASPGNWGKLDLVGTTPDGTTIDNVSSNPDFTAAMNESMCAVIDNPVATATGNAGTVSNVFHDLVGQVITVALTGVFENGSGTTPLYGYAKLRIIDSTGNGQNWVGTFQLVEINTVPPTAHGGPNDRRLVR